MFAISQALALPSGRSAPRKLGPVQTRPPAYKIDGSKNWNPLPPRIGTRFCHRPICRRGPLCCAYLSWLSHSLTVAARCDAQAGRWRRHAAPAPAGPQAAAEPGDALTTLHRTVSGSHFFPRCNDRDAVALHATSRLSIKPLGADRPNNCFRPNVGLLKSGRTTTGDSYV
jgi:hypothetical protein